MKIAVLGAGFTGLTTAYQLAKAGHQVCVFEKESRVGGLARGFKLPGWQWCLEESYHHLFASDTEAIELIKEVGLANKLFFKKPVTGVYYEKIKNQKSKIKITTQKLKVKTESPSIYALDTPLNFLAFPHLSPIDKFRSAAALGFLKTTPSWQHLERITAKEWILKYMGRRVWTILWEPLFINKFGKSGNKVPASWFWARIKKRSQKLGYIKGGFQTLAEKLVEETEKLGGKVCFNSEIQKISLLNESKNKNKNKKFSLQVKNLPRGRVQNFYFEKVVVSLPTPVFLKIADNLFQTHRSLTSNYIKRLRKITHLTAVTLILELKKPFLEKTYWLNICERHFPFLLLVDHTNFIKPRHYAGNHILYIGNYLPNNHPYLKKSKEELLQIFLPYLKRINPSYNFQFSIFPPKADPALRGNFQLFVSLFAQPVFPLNYSQIKAGLTTPIPDLFLANQDQIYPWDRGMNYAIELGKRVANFV